MAEKKERKARDDAPSRGEMAQMYKECKTFKEEFVLQILSRTGLRKGEFFHMKQHWIDWREGEIDIPARQRCLNNCQTHKDSDYWTPKNDQSARKVHFIDDKVEKWLGDYFDGDIVSVQENYSRSILYNIVKRVAERVDEKNNYPDKEPLEIRAYPHSLRAFYALRYAEMGASMAALMDEMGWKDPETARHYIRESGRAGKRETQEIRKGTDDIVRDNV